jgi:phenylalanine-4-hydroxylase
MVHDCLGHVPPLMDHDYAALMTLIARAAVQTTRGEHLLALKRISWFSIEFGLIEEAGETRVFGAGLLSSTGEMPFSLSADVERRPIAIDTVIATDYDPSKMQETLFVIPSFAFLRDEIEQFVKRLGLDVSTSDVTGRGAQQDQG